MGRRQTISSAVRAEVIATWGNECWLHLPGCTSRGEEDDHIRPYHVGGRDTVANIRRACKHCNASRQDRILNGYGATIHVLIGPPSADLYGELEGRATDTSIVVGFGGILNALYPFVNEPEAARRAAALAWDAAYRELAKCATPQDIWLLRTIPATRKHPRMLDEWLALDYDIHVIDPGAASVFDSRQVQDSPTLMKIARQWYSMHITQQLVDARQRQRREQLSRLGLRAKITEVTSRPEW